MARFRYIKTPPNACADAELKALIAALGLLENLVILPDEPGEAPGLKPEYIAAEIHK